MSSPRAGGGGGGGMGGGRATHGNPQGGDFDRTLCISSFHFIEQKRSKPFVSANFDNSFSPGDGDFDMFFRKCQNPHPMPDPLPPPPRPRP